MKRITVLLIIFAAFICISTSCNQEIPTHETTSPTTETSPVTKVITEEETTEPDTTVAIGGVPLSDFTIVYNSSFKNAAEVLASELELICGKKPKLSIRKVTEKAITITVSDELGYDDFKITQNEGSFVIAGGTVHATETACEKFLETFTSDKYKYGFEDFCISYTLPDRDQYINDISKLALRWELYFDTPEWMLDFEEKYATARLARGRLMSSAHRGDIVYYPENSVEGIIRAIMMGCDMVEIDPRLTKDGVFVLLHDATLSRTTNVSEMVGKNGLPKSAKVEDWTYEQLMQLNLKEGKGGAKARLTPYKIPTLDEVMQVCAGRILIQLDVKGPGNGKPFWDFERDVRPLLEKYDIHPQVIFTWHDWLKENNYDLIVRNLKISYAQSGKRNIVVFGDQGNYSKNDALVRKYGFNPCIRLFLSFGNTDYKEYLTNNKGKLDSYKHKLRTYANVTCKHESAEFYAELYEAGITFQLVDKALVLCTYIAENFEPTPYK